MVVVGNTSIGSCVRMLYSPEMKNSPPSSSVGVFVVRETFPVHIIVTRLISVVPGYMGAVRISP